MLYAAPMIIINLQSGPHDHLGFGFYPTAEAARRVLKRRCDDVIIHIYCSRLQSKISIVPKRVRHTYNRVYIRLHVYSLGASMRRLRGPTVVGWGGRRVVKYSVNRRARHDDTPLTITSIFVRHLGGFLMRMLHATTSFCRRRRRVGFPLVCLISAPTSKRRDISMGGGRVEDVSEETSDAI